MKMNRPQNTKEQDQLAMIILSMPLLPVAYMLIVYYLGL